MDLKNSTAQGRPNVTQLSVHWNTRAAGHGSRVQFTPFDAAYLDRLRNGDAVTERHFVAYFSELLGLKLRSRLNSRETIEDVRQETFLRVLGLIRAKDGIREPQSLGALVNAVCNHVLLEFYRSKSRTPASLDDEPQVDIPEPGLGVSGQFEVDQAERMVRTILSSLSDRDRRLLQSVFLEERDMQEVCAEMGLSRDHLRVLVHRAKQSFKASYLKRTGEA
jgi:RNA polymerase sigma-70 factor (ECF subfamily)